MPDKSLKRISGPRAGDLVANARAISEAEVMRLASIVKRNSAQIFRKKINENASIKMTTVFPQIFIQRYIKDYKLDVRSLGSYNPRS
jgi:hypothetical protein